METISWIGDTFSNGFFDLLHRNVKILFNKTYCRIRVGFRARMAVVERWPGRPSPTMEGATFSSARRNTVAAICLKLGQPETQLKEASQLDNNVMGKLHLCTKYCVGKIIQF